MFMPTAALLSVGNHTLTHRQSQENQQESRHEEEALEGEEQINIAALKAAVKGAQEALDQMCQDSDIFRNDPLQGIPRLDSKHFRIGDALGQGGYCRVHEMDYQEEKYAIKRVKPTLVRYPEELRYGIVDLAIEAAFLANLQHKNIIKLHGLSTQSMKSTADSVIQPDQYFLVLDRLYETLTTRIERWKIQDERKNQHQAKTYRWLLDRRLAFKPLQERIEVLVPVAEALAYFHSLGFMYRDLKPDNIGFDRDGTIKLFDFGMATTSKFRQDPSGSRRYMAPEAAQRRAYTNKVDVYSYGLLLWQVCALERPYRDWNRDQHFAKVVLGSQRPKIESWWPRSLQTLLRQCWNRLPMQRPPMEGVIQTLEEILQ